MCVGFVVFVVLFWSVVYGVSAEGLCVGRWGDQVDLNRPVRTLA